MSCFFTQIFFCFEESFDGELLHLLPAAGLGLSKVGLGKVGVVESLGKAEPALLDDLGKICS